MTRYSFYKVVTNIKHLRYSPLIFISRGLLEFKNMYLYSQMDNKDLSLIDMKKLVYAFNILQQSYFCLNL